MNNLVNHEQRQVFVCVEKNPGCCKRYVVSFLEGHVGRKSVLKNISVLIEKRMLIARKGKQIYQLYINKGDPVVILSCSIQQFNDAFAVLLDNIKKRLRELEKYKSKIFNEVQSSENGLLHAIFDIYQWFVYHNDSLRNTNFLNNYDRETLERIHLTMSDAIRKIQAKLLDFFSGVYKEAEIDLTYMGLCNPFEDNIITFYLLRRIFEANGLALHVERILDIMWKVSSNAPNFRRSRTLEFYSPTISSLSSNDWKKVLRACEEEFESPLVVNLKYQQRKLMYNLPLLGP